MSESKIREEFEREWGQVDAAQGVHFIPGLNTYGSELYAQHEYAQMKSSAWYYFQKGWAASRAALVIYLPKTYEFEGHCYYGAEPIELAIEAAGAKATA